jgi:hypothetical protein
MHNREGENPYGWNIGKLIALATYNVTWLQCHQCSVTWYN